VAPEVFSFPPLSDADWDALRTIGRIRVLPIGFDASTSRLTRDGAAVVDQVAAALVQNYPQYRVLIKGHTAPAGDEAANVSLSEERAQGVRNYLVTSKLIDPNRVRAVGVGSREPAPRQPGEGELSYRNRLARVEFYLLESSR
jgi:outer membrane protein OmpA-like peptidoglycan-associated protein